jgi:hypothetical protein
MAAGIVKIQAVDHHLIEFDMQLFRRIVLYTYALPKKATLPLPKTGGRFYKAFCVISEILQDTYKRTRTLQKGTFLTIIPL